MLTFPFLVNPLYPAVGSQVCLKPKFIYGWPLGLPTSPHEVCSSRDLGKLCVRGGRDRTGHQNLPTDQLAELLAHSSATSRLPRGELGGGLFPTASMTSSGNFTAALSTPWASLAIKLHVYVYYYKMREWVGCGVSFNQLYFYVRLLNMLLHTHKSIWVTKDIEHCLPKAVVKRERAQAAALRAAVPFRSGCSTQGTNLLLFLSSETRVPVFWNVCCKTTRQPHRSWKAAASQQIIFVHSAYTNQKRMKLFSRVEKSGQGTVVKQNRVIPKPLLQHNILPSFDGKTECCFFLAWISPPEVTPVHRRRQKEI